MAARLKMVEKVTPKLALPERRDKAMKKEKDATVIKVRICGALCIAMLYVFANSSYVQSPAQPDHRVAAVEEISSR
jgi:hypothetical protein